MSAPARSTDSMMTVRYVLIAALVATAFFVSYSFAVARNGSGLELAESAGGLSASGPGAGAAGFACCSNAGTGEAIEGATVVDGDVQRISVDASAGFAPNVIRAVAGVPLEITFSEGYGCMAQVGSRDLGFFEDLTNGPKTIPLPGLEAGEYGFSCGMEMVFGTIIVE